MRALKLPKFPALGAPAGGEVFAGVYLQGNTLRRLYVAGKEGDFAEQQYHSEYKRIAGALSLEDGLANTRAMARAGSVLAQKMLELRIGGHKDWCLGAHDQMYTAWKNLKFNAAAAALMSKKGGLAFADAVYWTSTQYAAYDAFAWVQDFSYGTQGYWSKDFRGRARAVRSEPI